MRTLRYAAFSLAIAAGCVAEPSLRSEEFAADRAPRPWVWPDFPRFADKQRIEARAILAIAGQGTVSDLLGAELLRERKPAAMYMAASRGLFKNAPNGPVSGETPRLLGAGGMVVLSLQNVPGHGESWEAVEMIAADYATATLDFYYLDLGKAVKAEQRIQKNPKRCDGCHDRRFIWGMYPYWPGRLSDNDVVANLPRQFGYPIATDFSLNLFELNLARIARELLAEKAFVEVERPVLAALLDCPVERFGFAGDAAFTARQRAIEQRYYREVAALVDETIQANRETGIAYKWKIDGSLESPVVLNRKDPIRYALIEHLLADAGIAKHQVDMERWSISRAPRETSILFQGPGGIGLSRLAFYLLHNSPNAEQLKKLVPQHDTELGRAKEPATAAEVCTALLEK